MLSDLGAGLASSSADLCPGVQDWEETMLNDETDNIHAVAYKSKAHKLAVVVFRGTQMTSMKNWQVDGDLDREELKLDDDGHVALVHEGFLTALKRVVPRVRKWVDGYVFGLLGDVPDSWRLVFAGHSLGGALATLATTMSQVEDWHRKPDATIVFGAPKVADAALGEWWERQGMCSKLLRVNVHNDVIHWLPTRKVSGLAEAANEIADCASNLRKCFFESSDKKTPAKEAGWAHVCGEERQLEIPGAMKGVNEEEVELSPFGGALAHYLSNCMYGYGYGMMHSPLAEMDAYCGLSPSLCMKGDAEKSAA